MPVYQTLPYHTSWAPGPTGPKPPTPTSPGAHPQPGSPGYAAWAAKHPVEAWAAAHPAAAAALAAKEAAAKAQHSTAPPRVLYPHEAAPWAFTQPGAAPAAPAGEWGGGMPGAGGGMPGGDVGVTPPAQRVVARVGTNLIVEHNADGSVTNWYDNGSWLVSGPNGGILRSGSSDKTHWNCLVDLLPKVGMTVPLAAARAHCHGAA